MTPAAEALVRSIVQLGLAGASPRALAQLAANALAAEGCSAEPLAAPVARPPPKTAAERQASRRARLRDTDVTMSRDASVTGGVGGGVSEIVRDPEQEGRAREGRTSRESREFRDAERDGENESGVVPVATSRVVRNATDDGCFGDTVAAWCEGVAKRTGGTYERRSLAPGAVRALVEALNAEAGRRALDGAAKVAMARELGAEYADAQQGATLNPFGFASWLGSNKPRRGAKVDTSTPYTETPTVKRARAEREAAMREAEENATPMPEELRRRVGLGKGTP